MKKYLRVIPLCIYPYAYLLFILFLILTSKEYNDDFFMDAALCVAVAYNIFVVFFVIYNAFVTAGDRYDLKTVAIMNLVIKGVQIPAYIFHFIIGFFGTLMSVWGIGLIMFAIIIDFITITLTGINSIGCSVKMYRDGAISKAKAVFMGIGCFIYCIDIVIALAYVIKAVAASGKRKTI